MSAKAESTCQRCGRPFSQCRDAWMCDDNLNKNLIEAPGFLYEVWRFGVVVYRKAVSGDMPTLFAKGHHWQSIGGWGL